MKHFDCYHLNLTQTWPTPKYYLCY